MMSAARPGSWQAPDDQLEPEDHPMFRLAAGAALLVVAVSLLGCQTSTGPTGAAPAAPAATVKAGALLQEYAANAVAADAKYKGKPLRVSGKFGSAQKVPLMGYAVELLPEDAGDVNLSGVQCFILESAEADVAKFKPGQMVTLEGTCDGQAVGQVKMSKCTVVK
jgi:tRNA_anti-like